MRLSLEFVSRQWEPWGRGFRLESTLGSSPWSLDERPVTKPNKGQDYASSVVKANSRSLLLGRIALAVHLVSLPNLG